MSHWQEIHPFIKILILLILFMMIIGGTGYILYIINEALDRWDDKKKQEAAKPITAIPRKRIDFKL